jgi:hypothetical protein
VKPGISHEENNKPLRRIFGPKEMKYWETGEGCRMRRLIISTLPQM